MGGCSFFGFRADGRRFLLMNIFGGGWGGRPREDGKSASVSICRATCAMHRWNCKKSSILS